MTIVCGQAEAAAPDSLFWTLGDGTLTIQSPFDGTLQSLTKQMVAGVDLDKWAHLPRAAAAEPAATTGQSQSGPVR